MGGARHWMSSAGLPSITAVFALAQLLQAVTLEGAASKQELDSCVDRLGPKGFYEYAGSDIDVVHYKAPQACLEICLSASKCHGFVLRNDGSCHLKHGDLGAIQHKWRLNRAFQSETYGVKRCRKRRVVPSHEGMSADSASSGAAIRSANASSANSTAAPIAEAGLPCPEGCEEVGNCNRARGVCECPIGYTGPTCRELTYPSCRAAPDDVEMFCSLAQPKSCDCVRECKQHYCPYGDCDMHYDWHNAHCFDRPANYSVVENGVTWGGGSAIPAAKDTDVRYYRGVYYEKYAEEGTITREEFLDMEPNNPNGLSALPLDECPERCHVQGGCMQRKQDKVPHCLCHYGFFGTNCKESDKTGEHRISCYNRCQGRGTCRRGFCHCEKGWWGKDCSSSRAYADHSATAAVHKLRVYAYDLPWQVASRREPFLNWSGDDGNYGTWKNFAARFYSDTVARTENPWEANMFYIPAMTYGYSSNLGDTVTHSRRVIEYVRQTWPFFNRTGGADHFIWLTNDRGACFWPGEEEPAMANVIKVTHFGWYHVGENMPPDWGPLPNKHWGCFHPQRDIVPAPFWFGQSRVAARTYGLLGAKPTFRPDFVPTDKLLFFAGGIRPNEWDYSNGVRQALHKMFGAGQHPNVTFHEGGIERYEWRMQNSKFCMAPFGHGWGIRLSQYMLMGCVPVVIQDGVYQFWEDQLPYSNFSVRIAQGRIPEIVEILSAVSDEDYLLLKRGMLEHWRAFVWDADVGGLAYEYMLRSLMERVVRLNAGFIPLLGGGESTAQSLPEHG